MHDDEQDGLAGQDASRGSVAAALAELSALDELALADHPDVYQRIHADLQGALAEIDDD